MQRRDPGRRGHRTDRSEGTAIAALKTRRQICCDGSRGLRLWRSAQGCDREDQDRITELHHAGTQTHPRRQKLPSDPKHDNIFVLFQFDELSPPPRN